MTQTDNFAWALAFAKWPIFKMVSFLEYFVFFRAVVCTELLSSGCRIDFCMFFGILIFDANRHLVMGYSLCKMADFQNGLISWIFGVFSSRFFRQNYFNLVVQSISACFFGILIFDPNRQFCMGYKLCKMAHFQNGLISWIFRFFSRGLLHRTILMRF